MDKRSFSEGFRRAWLGLPEELVDEQERAWSSWLNEVGEGDSTLLTPIKASDDELQFRLVVKFKNEVLMDVMGFPRRLAIITAKDMADAFEAERIIEKLIGLRVHILQIAG